MKLLDQRMVSELSEYPLFLYPQFPVAMKTIIDKHYVDAYIYGVESEEKAINSILCA